MVRNLFYVYIIFNHAFYKKNSVQKRNNTRISLFFKE